MPLCRQTPLLVCLVIALALTTGSAVAIGAKNSAHNKAKFASNHTAGNNADNLVSHTGHHNITPHTADAGALIEAPVMIVSGPIETDEDTPSTTVTITVTDADTPLTDITLTATSANTDLIPEGNITLVAGPPGTWTLSVTPALNAYGIAEINLIASDLEGDTDEEPVSVTVNGVNDAPTLSPIGDLTIAEGAVAGPLSITITDVDGFTGHNVTAVSSNISLVNASGIALGGGGGSRTITLTPQAGASGATTITVTLTDGPFTLTEDFVLTVNPSASPVIAVSGSITTNEDTPSGAVTITVTDADTPAGSLTLTATTANGMLIPQASISLVAGPAGTWTLSVTPALNQSGTTQINLVAGDGTPSHNQSQPVSVTVNAVNDAPTLSPIGDLTIAEGAVAGPLSITITDVDGFTGHTVTAVSSNISLVNASGIALGGGGGSRTITLTPQAGASGATTITVTLTDGPFTLTEDFVLTVNPSASPVIAVSGSITTNEDTPSGAVTITVTDADTPAGSLTLTATTANGMLIPQASISLVAGPAGTWTLSVTPALNQSGTTQINLVAGDGTPSHNQSQPVSVTVNAVNDAPTLSPIGDLTIAEGAVAGPLSITITDVDGFTGHTVTAVSSNISLVNASGIALGGGGGSRTITLTPQAGASGATTITVTLTDGPFTLTEDFVLTVNPSASPVIAVSGSITTNEDTPSGAVTITVTDADTPAGSLTLTATTANGMLIPQASISLVAGPAGTWTLSVTPALNQSGTTQINLVAGDGTPSHNQSQPVSVTVNAVNDAPTLSPIGDLTIAEGAVAGPLSITITDVDGFTGHTVTAVSSNISLVNASGIALGGGGGSRTITLTPQAGASGATTITVTLTDGPFTLTEDFVLTVNPSASPVIAVSGSITTNEDTPSGAVTITVTDADTPAGSLTLTATTANGMLIPQASISLVAGPAGTWTLSVTPALNQSGTTQINLVAGDGTPSHNQSQPVSVTVNGVNDAPTISSIGPQSIDQNTSTSAIPFTVSDIETAAGLLTLEKVSSNTTLVPLANVIFGGSAGSRNVTITPVAGLFGTASITVTVRDGSGASNATAQTTFELTVREVNAPPFFVQTIGNRTIDEDIATGSLPFTVGDPNTSLNVLTVSGSSSNTELVDQGGIAIGGAGASRNVTITPNINANGITNITLRVSDGALFADMSFVLTVNPVNDLPTITSIPPQNIDENQQTGLLGFTISDLETLPVNLSMISASSNVELADQPQIVLGGNGSQRSVNVIPKINKSGTATITLTVRDEHGGTAQTAFLLSVAAIDAPPTISAISDFAINEDTPSTAIPFTVSDLDVPLDNLVVTHTSSNTGVVASGGVALVETSPGNWTVQITPVANAFGSSLITLTVDDGTEQATEEFTVTVNSVNDLPVITPVIPTQNINEDSNTGAIGFAVSDVETPAASLTVTRSSSNTTLVPEANIVIAGSAGSRTITVTPVADEWGNADITIKVTDANSGETTQTFTVTVAAVNDAPTISGIANQNIDEDQAGGTGSLPFTVGDKEAGTLTVDKASTNLVLVPLENITVAGSGASRTVTVVPVANGFGTATITLTVTDEGGLSGNTSFNVVVAAVNDPPTITTPPNQTIAENTSTGPIPFTVGDVESLGSLVVTRATSNTAVIPLANVVLAGSGASRTVTVSPLASQSGTSTITLTVTDGTTPVSTTFDVIVTPVEDPPTISAISDVTIAEDAATSAIPFTINDPDTPVGSLGVSKTSDNQSLVPDANVVLGGSGSARTVTVTPLPNQNGTATITITVTDGTNVVTEAFVLTVTPVNDAPTITTIADQTTNEDTPTGSIGFTVGDLETTPASLTVTATSDNATLVPNAAANIELTGEGVGAARTIRVVPAENASGVANITVTVSDGTATATRIFKVTVSPVNDAPTISAIADQTINEDAATGALAFTIGDIETPGTLQVTRSSSNTTLIPIANVVLGGSGASRTVTITPALNQSGTSTISITVDDGTSTTTLDFVVTVVPVNDPPTISSITNRTIQEDVSTGAINFTISDPETAAADLVVTATSDNTTLFPLANIVLGGTTGTRNVTVQPAADLNGSGTITISVSDGVNSTDRTFTITVTPVNDLPVITSQEPIAVNEGVSVTLDFVMLHVTDPDNVVSELTLIPFGGANYSITGSSTIKPDPFYNGPLTVPVRVADGGGLGPVFNVAITVNSTNDPPVITGQPGAITMDEDQTFTVPLSAFAVSDPDSDPSKWTLIVLPGTNYTVTNGNQITPALNYNGPLSVSVKVNDTEADSAPFNATVTVNPVNDPPTITDQVTISVNEDTELTINAGMFTITDPEVVPFNIVLEPAAPGASYTITGGTTIKPIQDFNGVMTVPVRANDGFLNSAVFNAQITVIPVNDPPVIVGQSLITTVEDIPVSLKLAQLDVTDVDNTYPTGFSLTVLPGTDYTFTQVSTTEYLITPALDVTGNISVNVQVSDGLASSAVRPITITVSDDADAPVITGPKNPLTILEDQQGTLTLNNLTWTDADSQAADLTIDVLPGTNYTFQDDIIRPVANYFGTLTVNVRLYDGEAYSNIFPLAVVVTPVDDPPFFNAIATINILEDAPLQTLNITGISAGPNESQTMTLSFISDNTSLIQSPNALTLPPGTTSASVTFRPNPNESGVVNLKVSLVDIAPGFVRDIVINVNSVNDAPSFTMTSEWNMDEGTPEQTVALSDISPGGGQPEANQSLLFIVGTDNNDLFETLPQVQNPAAGQTTANLVFKAKENAFGVANITVRLQDNGASSPPPNTNFVEKTLTLTINPVNDPPVVVSEPPGVAEPGKEYKYELIVTDADNDVITITAPGLPSWLTLTLGENGHATISGIPPQSESGKTIAIALIATDEVGVTASGNYPLTLNSRPVVSNFSMAVAEDTQLSITASDFKLGFFDADGNAIAEVLILSLPEHGILRTSAGAVAINQKLSADQMSTLVYDPQPDYAGSDNFLWTGADGFGAYPADESGAILTITVNEVNDGPTFVMEPESDTLKYELGSEERVRLTRQFKSSDDSGVIRGAQIGFNRIDGFQFRPENDQLIYEPLPGSRVSGAFDNGVLTLTGEATTVEYDSAIAHILYRYTNATEFLLDMRSVSIVISDGFLSSAPQSRLIQLIYTFEDLEIPSAFSPNEGDDVNNVWNITSRKGEDLYADAEVRVYNKNGVLLFQTKGLQDPWTGIYNGSLLPTDTYYYTIDLHYNKVRYKGAVTLLR